MSYEEYAVRVPKGKLDLILDAENKGVELHLHQIADELDDWDIKLAPVLGLKATEIRDVRSKYRDEPAQQRWVFFTRHDNDIPSLHVSTKSVTL